MSVHKHLPTRIDASRRPRYSLPASASRAESLVEARWYETSDKSTCVFIASRSSYEAVNIGKSASRDLSMPSFSTYSKRPAQLFGGHVDEEPGLERPFAVPILVSFENSNRSGDISIILGD